MIEIDGSHGEGGGQILRTSCGLATLLKTDCIITNIRKNRPKRGLSHQHVHALSALKKYGNVETEGLELGSQKIEFQPNEIEKKKIVVKIPTAGSCTLVLQALTIPMIFFGGTAIIHGGTDVMWSPSADYVKNVTFKILEKMGVKIKIEIEKRGYYPRGGGEIRVSFQKVKKLNPIRIKNFSEMKKIFGVSHTTLSGVAERQKMSARKYLMRKGFDAEVFIENWEGFPGSGITLWAETDASIVASSSLGKKGKRAEIVGEEAASELFSTLEKKTIDKYLGDQLIPYIALADGRSRIAVPELTNHLNTNIWVTEKFLDVEFDVGDCEISVDGIGFMG